VRIETMKTKVPRKDMWAILKDGEPYMILPDLDTAETHYGIYSRNGYSEYHWTIQQVIVEFPGETASQRRERQARHVQQVVELNRAMMLADEPQ
jgi:hypothetical protein